MEIRNFIQEKLYSYKNRIIKRITNSEGEDGKRWSDEWLKSDLVPPPYGHFFYIETPTGKKEFSEHKFSSLFILVRFGNAHEKFLAGEYVASLEILFELEHSFGVASGIQDEKDRIIKRNTDNKVEPPKRAAIQYYRKHNLSEMSGQKAAEELAKHAGTGLKFETLYRYVLAYRKQEKLVNSSLPKARADFLAAFSELAKAEGEDLKELPVELEEFFSSIQQKALDAF